MGIIAWYEEQVQKSQKRRGLKQKSIETDNAVCENKTVNANTEQFSVTIPTILPLLSEDNHAKKMHY